MQRCNAPRPPEADSINEAASSIQWSFVWDGNGGRVDDRQEADPTEVEETDLLLERSLRTIDPQRNSGHPTKAQGLAAPWLLRGCTRCDSTTSQPATRIRIFQTSNFTITRNNGGAVRHSIRRFDNRHGFSGHLATPLSFLGG
ncbi:hypothetical protein Pla52o_27540 [Novipirellula galeiformis]|uniref:Uncharacterized protein n=1 Tax=Novipirellula galeiformis TaxID=2528004 RepID=A0A5C6CFZ2_9BACT|nr:hypothetical protein Pla52o_27540 [Novipirellula galeiformis]